MDGSFLPSRAVRGIFAMFFEVEDGLILGFEWWLIVINNVDVSRFSSPEHLRIGFLLEVGK